MGTVKDRNGMDLTEAEDIKKRWKDYIEEIYHPTPPPKKKILMSQITMIIAHSESDFLKCEVKWALGSITMYKASAGDGISAELFQILKDDGVKVLH